MTKTAENYQFVLAPEWEQDGNPIRTLQAGKLIAHSFLSGTKDERMSFARTFCSLIVQTLWTRVQGNRRPTWSLPEPFVRTSTRLRDVNAISLSVAMSEAASQLDLNTASYLIGTIYTSLIPDEDRSRFGAYYTPPPLAGRLVDMAAQAGIDWRTCKTCDPACGGGAFLVPVARKIVEENEHLAPKMLVRTLSERLRGWEIDPFAAWLAQVFLELSVVDVCRRAGERLPTLVEVSDSLVREDIQPYFDLVIGNPPYGRLSLDPDVRDRYRRSLYGHANLYGLFTDLAVQLTRPGGVIAYVTPTSFLAGEYFKSLRAVLANEAKPVNIDFVSVRKGIFEDVLQETLLATYKRGSRTSRVTVNFISPQEHGSIAITPAGQFRIPPQASGPWLIPRTSSEGKLVATLQCFDHRLKDYGYEVSTGPLVWNRHKEQLRTKVSAEVLPLIWAECITADGQFTFRALRKNHKPYFAPFDGDDWLISREACILMQRTTAKEQSRRLITAELPQIFINKYGGVVVENHVNMIKPIMNKPLVPSNVLTTLLNSSIVDRAFRCISGSVAVSAYELEALPLPPPDRVQSLAAFVSDITDRYPIEQFCRKLFENNHP